MTDLPSELQAIVDAALHDGDGWVIAADADPQLVDRLEAMGLVRWWKGRHDLTPQGFAHTRRFKGVDNAAAPNGSSSRRRGSSAGSASRR